MRRVMDYQVIESPAAENAIVPPLMELQARVSHLLQQGWQPLGGIATAERLRGGYEKTFYLQAMVRYEPDEQSRA